MVTNQPPGWHCSEEYHETITKQSHQTKEEETLVELILFLHKKRDAIHKVKNQRYLSSEEKESDKIRMANKKKTLAYAIKQPKHCQVTQN